jgi:ABC-type transporter Mla maintaining outer membrane lipid asymmetry ATPase subunit MlaF
VARVVTEEPLLRATGIVKNYHALRPLRLAALNVGPGDIVSLDGLDAAAAELFVGLVTGALLPDEGEIALFGRSTRDVDDSAAWLAMLDGVGILTDRAVLISQFSIEQNLAMPFTLEIDPVAAAVRLQVEALARDVGLRAADLATPVSGAPGDMVARVRLARALALGPRLLLAEHPSATVPRDAVRTFAGDMRRVADARQLAVVAVTADAEFAAALGGTRLTLDPATGIVRSHSTWRKLFGR